MTFCFRPVFASLLFVALASSVSANPIDWNAKHIPRIGPNLAQNANFNGMSGWLPADGAVYDPAVTRTADGSGSVKLSGLYDSFKTPWFPSFVPVTPGETYTFSAYTKTTSANNLPTPIVSLRAFYRDSNGTPVTDVNGSGKTRTLFGPQWGNSKPGEWEEMTAIINPPPGAAVVDLQIWISDPIKQGTNNLPVNREAWVDDIYFGQGIGFEQPPTPKTPFNGSVTRIDELGNIEVNKNGVWEPFFPLAMYGDGDRPDWNDYSNQGFNMEMRANRATGNKGVNRAKAAGMMSALDISRFMIDTNDYYNDVGNLTFRVNELKSEGVMEDVLFYYWDNEAAYDEWAVPERITDALKLLDVDADGNRMHPIYTLNGNSGFARRHLTDPSNPPETTANFSDITGTYIGDGYGRADLNASGRTAAFRTLDNIENQRQPVVIAQINRGVGDEMRARLFGAIAHGARGMGFWSDDYGGANDVTLTSWWSDFPNMAAEIDAMMNAGLIQVPHWTAWTLETTDNDIDVGTRDLNGEGYFIVANYADSNSVVTFTLGELASLGYTPVEVRDFFDDSLVATIVGNQFDITLNANGSGVYRLVAPPSNLGDFDGDLDVDGADFLVWQRGQSPNGATIGDLAEWQENFGTLYGGATASATVPEPHSGLLAISALLSWTIRPRRKGSGGLCRKRQ